MFGTRPDHVRGGSRFLTKRRKHGVQAMSWCAGHVQDASEPRQGRSLIFRHFRAVFRHGVQTMFGMRPDHDSLSWKILGFGVQAMSGTPHGHDSDEAYFQAIREVSRTRCACHVQDAVGMHPDFQGFSQIFRHFKVASWTRCAGPVEDAAGTQPDFLTFIGNFLEHCVQAMTGTCPAIAGMQPDFLAFLGSFWALCAGHVDSEPNFQVILGNFWDTAMSRSRLGRGRDVAWFPGSFWDTAMFGTRLSCDGDAA
ncbi:Hypothetical predicted protein [Olea europaea subsp. europaea]|uniref:Uncharacterized protein n=1 Tax=Olea europaea subsp. europaea TaxID=158383 RepID=A0A8S0SY72_OLEEU|nr:Hypothetical predicted protein [Olea europaea subsp. europaea]